MEFERCIDFLVRMIDKYGYEVLRDTSRDISRDTSRHISRYGLLGHFAVLTLTEKRRRGIIKRSLQSFYY